MSEQCPKCGSKKIIKECWPAIWIMSGVKQAWACGSYVDKDNNFIRGGIGESSCYARELSAAQARIAELEANLLNKEIVESPKRLSYWKAICKGLEEDVKWLEPLTELGKAVIGNLEPGTALVRTYTNRWGIKPMRTLHEGEDYNTPLEALKAKIGGNNGE